MTRFLSLTTLILALFSLFQTGFALAIADKPAIIFVPGAFHGPAVFDEVKHQLSTVGYTELHAIELPSVGYMAAGVDRRPDIKAVQKAIREQLDKGKDIVLVGNSYGATVVGDALKDFEYRSAVNAPASVHGKILGVIMVSSLTEHPQSESLHTKDSSHTTRIQSTTHI